MDSRKEVAVQKLMELNAKANFAQDVFWFLAAALLAIIKFYPSIVWHATRVLATLTRHAPIWIRQAFIQAFAQFSATTIAALPQDPVEMSQEAACHQWKRDCVITTLVIYALVMVATTSSGISSTAARSSWNRLWHWSYLPFWLCF